MPRPHHSQIKLIFDESGVYPHHLLGLLVVVGQSVFFVSFEAEFRGQGFEHFGAGVRGVGVLAG